MCHSIKCLSFDFNITTWFINKFLCLILTVYSKHWNPNWVVAKTMLFDAWHRWSQRINLCNDLRERYQWSTMLFFFFINITSRVMVDIFIIWRKEKPRCFFQFWDKHKIEGYKVEIINLFILQQDPRGAEKLWQIQTW